MQYSRSQWTRNLLFANSKAHAFPPLRRFCCIREANVPPTKLECGDIAQMLLRMAENQPPAVIPNAHRPWDVIIMLISNAVACSHVPPTVFCGQGGVGPENDVLCHTEKGRLLMRSTKRWPRTATLMTR